MFWQEPSREQITAVLSAASRFPQNSIFFLVKTMGRSAFSPRLSKRFDNGAENGVRPLALGRKNHLFCGNHEAARGTAIIYSLPGTCKINSINPTQWLTDVFNKILDTKVNDITKLLPQEWEIIQNA